MESKEKEARFDLYCRYCKFNALLGREEPCNECLNSPANEDSHVPVLFEKAAPIINFLLPDNKSYTRDIRKSRWSNEWPSKQELNQYFTVKDGDYWEKQEVEA